MNLKNTKTSNNIKNSKLFVGGVPPDTNHGELLKYFTSFGQVRKLDLPKNHSWGTIKGFAFVTFQKEQSARLAVSHKKHLLREKILAVNMALSPQEAGRKTKRLQNQKIFVRGLPQYVETSVLKTFFGHYGPVELAIIPKKKGSRANKGIAYVIMRNKADYNTILKIGSLDFFGRQIQVAPATAPKELQEKKQNLDNPKKEGCFSNSGFWIHPTSGRQASVMSEDENYSFNLSSKDARGAVFYPKITSNTGSTASFDNMSNS